jgi:flagellar basal body-associated protein FliL
MKQKILLILITVMMAIIIFIGGILTLTLTDIFSEKEEEKKVDSIQEYSYRMDSSVITNVNNSKKYVKCRLVFKLENESQQKFFEDKSYIIRDIIIETLRGFSERDYEADNIKLRISEVLKARIEEDLDVTGIKSIYFEELITQ